MDMKYLNSLFLFFFKIFSFRAVLGFQQNQEEHTEISHIPLPPHMHSLPLINITYQNGTFFTKGEPMQSP